jgi:hypothetical protein
MNFEKQFLDAIASKLLEDGTDSYGNKQESPIRRFISSWAENNRVEILAEVAKKISVEQFAGMIVEKVKSSLNSSYWGEAGFREEIKRETIRQLACENTKTIMEKMKQEEAKGE